MSEKRKNKKGMYWYRFVHFDCPVCGRGRTHKARVYDEPKPDDVYERHLDIPSACSNHFV